MSSPELRFECPKCRHTTCEIGEIRASGGFWSKIFDVQNRKLATVTCEQCRYTEFTRPTVRVSATSSTSSRDSGSGQL